MMFELTRYLMLKALQMPFDLVYLKKKQLHVNEVEIQ